MAACKGGPQPECPKCGKTAADFRAGAVGLRCHIYQCTHVDQWTQCDSCEKRRRLSGRDYVDEFWTCFDNADIQFNRCEVPQELTNEQIDAEIHASYVKEHSTNIELLVCHVDVRHITPNVAVTSFTAAVQRPKKRKLTVPIQLLPVQTHVARLGLSTSTMLTAVLTTLTVLALHAH